MISEDARPHEDADHEESQYTEWLSSERRICQRMEWMEHLSKQGRTEEFVLDPGLWTQLNAWGLWTQLNVCPPLSLYLSDSPG